MEPEIGEALIRYFESEGIRVTTVDTYIHIETTESGVRLHVASNQGEQMLDAGMLLVATGRNPNTNSLNLSAVGIMVSRAHPAWGYRLVGGVLRLRNWKVNNKRVYRLWRALGQSLPPYKPSKKIRTGVKLDQSAQKRNDVWAVDFVHDSFGGGRAFRCLTIKDKATGFCLATEVAVSFRNTDVQRVLQALMTRYGRPKALRSDNGPEFVAQELQEAITSLGYAAQRSLLASLGRTAVTKASMERCAGNAWMPSCSVV